MEWSHFDVLVAVKKSGTACVECLAQGMRWVHLRECL